MFFCGILCIRKGGATVIESKLYAVEDLVELLHLKNRRTIYRWIKEGKINAVKVSKRWYVTESEIQRLLLEGENHDQGE